MPIKIREPSSGGIGIRLNIPKTTFITIRFPKMKLAIKDGGICLDTILKINAKIKFAAGPAAPTQIISLLGFFRAQ
jgi:hypothetical protein